MDFCVPTNLIKLISEYLRPDDLLTLTNNVTGFNILITRLV